MYSLIHISSDFIENLHEDIFIYHLFIDSLKVYSTLSQVNKYLYNLSQQVQIKNLLEPIIMYIGNIKKEYSVFKESDIKHGIYRIWSNEKIIKECHYKEGKKDALYRKWHYPEKLNEELYYNKQLSKECHYKEGKIDGLFRKWHYNGKLSEECHYKEGKIDGLFRKWHYNGKLNEECLYKESKIDGLFRKWYYNGELSDECHYKEGKLNGLKKLYYGHLIKDSILSLS